MGTIGWPELMTYGPFVCGGVVILGVVILILLLRRSR